MEVFGDSPGVVFGGLLGGGGSLGKFWEGSWRGGVLGLVFGCLGSGGIRASAWVVESTTPAVRRQGGGMAALTQLS